ncbi:MAG: anaerobic ribonucleoside-triphosphate reductase [Desulfotignum sp.]|nr:anaerobic ribonucleoside-triphosphate reductase [Desulfotignum sp.]
MDQGIASPDGQAFAVRVMDHMRQRIEALQAQTDEIFNLEATPAEGTTYRFCESGQKEIFRYRLRQ